ncbi:MAG TPA: helix-turn-helix domain-containing protein [Kofleriaceae bacterium]
MWLRAGRAQRKLTLDDVARVTKIQPRILEKIEAGNLEGLPAEVFVRGFVKSFARCVGLDETEAVERYGQCANASALPTTSVARAFVETLVAAPKSANANANAPTILEAPPEILPSASMELTPIAEHPDLAGEPEIEIVVAPIDTASIEAPAPAPAPAIEVIEIGAAPVEEAPKKKRSRKKANGAPAAPRSRKKKSAAAGTGSSPVVVAQAEPDDPVEALATVEAAPLETAIAAAAPEAPAPEPEPSAADQFFAPSDGIVIEQDVVEAAAEAPPETAIEMAVETAPETSADAPAESPVVTDPWHPTMPAVVASVPWKRPTSTFKATTLSPYALPSLVIDDADPDNAEREREDREIAKGPHRVSFLPPILLDREDKSGRQGGLTLAVILLLIAATLTLSYLMRRPSVSGDGVTQAHVDTTEIVA